MRSISLIDISRNRKSRSHFNGYNNTLSHDSVIAYHIDAMVDLSNGVSRCLSYQTLLIAVCAASNVIDSEVDRHMKVHGSTINN